MSITASLLQAAPSRFGLWPSVWKLLRLRLRIWINTFLHAKLRSKIGRVLLALLIVALMVGLFLLSNWLLGFLHSPELAQLVDPAQFIAAIPTLVLTAAFVLTVLTNFGILLQALYLSKDMDFLISSPLPMRAVFLAKLLEAILPNFALFCAFSLPVLFGLGLSNHYNFLYYPLLVVMLIMLALAAGGLASILVMAVVRVFPARRVAEVLGVLGAMISVLIGQTGNIMNAAGINRADFSGALGTFTRLNTPWSPVAWAGRGLLAVGHAEWLVGIGLSVLILALAGALFAGTLRLAEQLYYTGWASMQGSVRKKRAPRPIATTPGAAAQTAAVAQGTSSQPIAPSLDHFRVFPAPPTSPRQVPAIPWIAILRVAAPVRGLFLKDLLLLRRDPRNLSQLITPLILGFVLLFTTRLRGGGNFGRSLGNFNVGNLEMYILIVLAIFVGWMLLTNLAPLAFSREGKNYWILKSAPLSPINLMTGKYLISFVPTVVFCLTFLTLGFAIRGISWAYYPFCALVAALSIAGATGIALAFGAAGANLEWDSPQRQRLQGFTGCLMIIVVMGFLAFDLVLFFIPSAAWQFFTGSESLLPYLVGLVLGGSAAGIAAFLPLRLVINRLAQIGEN